MPDSVVHPSVVDALAKLGIAYEVVGCEPEYADTAAFCERYGYPLETSANTILIASTRGEKRYAACVVRADQRLDVNHAVRRLMEVPRASFASAEETMALTGMAIGGVTAFGLPADLPLYLDEGLQGLPYVILGSGTRSSKIKTSPQELAKVPNARFVACVMQQA